MLLIRAHDKQIVWKLNDYLLIKAIFMLLVEFKSGGCIAVDTTKRSVLEIIITLALPKSSQSRRIVAMDDIMAGMSSMSCTLSLVTPSPRRKNTCTSPTFTPELIIPFFKYSSALGKCPEANHLASTRNALHKLAHWSKKQYIEITLNKCCSSFFFLFLNICYMSNRWLGSSVLLSILTAFLRDCTGLCPCIL